MSEAAVLWLLGTLVGFLTLLVGAIYMNVIRNQDKSDKRIDGNKEANDDDHDTFWDEINKLKDRINVIDTARLTVCQRHEDHFDLIDGRVKQATDDIYKWRHLLTEIRSNLENRMNAVENSIRVLADIAHDLKNAK